MKTIHRQTIQRQPIVYFIPNISGQLSLFNSANAPNSVFLKINVTKPTRAHDFENKTATSTQPGFTSASD